MEDDHISERISTLEFDDGTSVTLEVGSPLSWRNGVGLTLRMRMSEPLVVWARMIPGVTRILWDPDNNMVLIPVPTVEGYLLPLHSDLCQDTVRILAPTLTPLARLNTFRGAMHLAARWTAQDLARLFCKKWQLSRLSESTNLLFVPSLTHKSVLALNLVLTSPWRGGTTESQS